MLSFQRITWPLSCTHKEHTTPQTPSQAASYLIIHVPLLIVNLHLALVILLHLLRIHRQLVRILVYLAHIQALPSSSHLVHHLLDLRLPLIRFDPALVAILLYAFDLSFVII